MICAYGPYSASATGGNGWSRDFLAGVLTVPATPFYSNIGGAKHLEYASTILFCISVVLVIAVYVIYWKGPTLRKRSPFAESLAAAQHERDERAAGAGLQRPRPISRLSSSQLSQLSYPGFQRRQSATSLRREAPGSRQSASGVQVSANVDEPPLAHKMTTVRESNEV
jgi:hypothetical protein